MTHHRSSVPIADLQLAYSEYLERAREHEHGGRLDAAWACLEASHVLGQRITSLHVRSHARMLGLAWRTRNYREVCGQLLRVAAAVLISRIWVPRGNTGSANVNPWRSMPVPSDLEQLLGQHDAGHKPKRASAGPDRLGA